MTRCSNCGKELSSADAPCTNCAHYFDSYELKFTTQTPLQSQKTKICPRCGEKFSPMELRFTFYPYGAKWYSPKKPELSCPYCFGYIKSKYKVNTALIVMLPVLFLISNKYLGVYNLILLVPYTILLLFRAIKIKKDLYEFVVSEK